MPEVPQAEVDALVNEITRVLQNETSILGPPPKKPKLPLWSRNGAWRREAGRRGGSTLPLLPSPQSADRAE
jgi:hypothetical protein